MSCSQTTLCRVCLNIWRAQANQLGHMKIMTTLLEMAHSTCQRWISGELGKERNGWNLRLRIGYSIIGCLKTAYGEQLPSWSDTCCPSTLSQYIIFQGCKISHSIYIYPFAPICNVKMCIDAHMGRSWCRRNMSPTKLFNTSGGLKLELAHPRTARWWPSPSHLYDM